MSEKEHIQEEESLPLWLGNQLDILLKSPAHALLIHGASGLGQYELAHALVKSWLCEAPGKQSSQAACGQCASCLQIKAHSHTDLIVLMPETLKLELGWPLSEKAQKEIDEKKRKPSKEIRIDDVRDAVAFAELTSGRGQGKAILVYPAEAMNIPAANALLKTLEEPASSLKFALACEAAHELLPTIRSRCQAFALHWPQTDQAIDWLKNQVPEARLDQLQTALAASGGRPGDALSTLDFIATSADSAWEKLPKAIQKGAFSAFSGLQNTQILDILQKICHDLWAVKLGSPPRFFQPQDLPRPPSAQALETWNEQLKDLRKKIEHPWKPDLLLENLISQAKRTLQS